MRVMSVCSASTCRSNIRRMCSVNESGTPDRRAGQLTLLAAAVAGLDRLDAALDLADVVEVADRGGSGRWCRARCGRSATSPAIQSRMLRRVCAALGAILGRRARAEQHVEGHPRVADHRQRLVGRRPADRVGVGARVVVGAAAGLVEVLDAELHRRQRGRLAEALGVHLVHRRAAPDVGALRLLGVRLGQEHRARAEVIAADLRQRERLGHAHVGVADDGQVVAVGLERPSAGCPSTSSKSLPVCDGAKRYFVAAQSLQPARPCTSSIAIRRVRCPPARVLPAARRPGSSRPGTAGPRWRRRLRRKVRRGRCFPVMKRHRRSPRWRGRSKISAASLRRRFRRRCVAGSSALLAEGVALDTPRMNDDIR